MDDGRTHAAATVEKERMNAAIESARAEVAATLGELRGAVADQFDWRGWVRRRPLMAVALALAIGWRIGRGRFR